MPDRSLGTGAQDVWTTSWQKWTVRSAPTSFAASRPTKLPLLEDDGQAIVGARAIVSYLERTAGPPSVFPADPQKRNQAVTLAEFAEQVIGPLVAAAEQGGAEELAELRARLGHVREAIGRRALDSGSCHFGDLSVAAHLEACRGLRGLDFTRDHADLAAFIERVRLGCGER